MRSNVVSKPLAVVGIHGSGKNGLGTVRSLGRQRVPVHILGIEGHRDLPAFSRYCVARTQVAACDGELLYGALKRIADDSSSRPVLYLDNDKMMIALAPYANELEQRFFLTSPLRGAEQLTDKVYQMDVARQAGLTIPSTWFPHSWDDIEQITVRAGTRLIAKPSPAHFPGDPPFKTVMGQSASDLVERLQARLPSPDGLLVQEYIEGADSAIYISLCYCPRNGGTPKVLTGIKLRQYPPGAGVMAVGKTMDAPIVREQTLRYVSALHLTGIAGIEFKYSAQDQRFYFVELSPRTELFHTIGWGAGLDLPLLAYRDACGEDISAEQVDTARTFYWIDFTADLRSLAVGRNAWKMGSIVAPYLGPKEWAVWRPDDPGPWLWSHIAFASETGAKLRTIISGKLHQQLEQRTKAMP